MCMSTAQARTRHNLGASFFCKFWHKMALGTCPCAFWLRGLSQNGCPGLGPCMIFSIFSRSLSEDLVETLVRSFWWYPLFEVLAWRSCRCHVSEVLVWKLLWEALGRFLYQDLVRSAPAAAGPFLTILWHSFRVLAWRSWSSFFSHVLVTRTCGDPSEMRSKALAWSCTGPCEKILKGSYWKPLGHIRLKSFSRGPCIKTLKMLLCVGACVKVFLGCS